MNEENLTDTSPVVVTGDMSEVTEKLDELKEALTTEPEKVIVNDVEMSSDEVLVEILNSLQPDPEEVEKQNTVTQNQQVSAENQEAILQELLTVNQDLFNEYTAQFEIMEQRHNEQLEGYFFVGLSIIISFAVYMFWNQISKW